jgi:hypothetical protein
MTSTTPTTDDPRQSYLREVIRLYLQAPDTPSRAARSDWAVAADLFARNVPLTAIAQAIRIASLRRRLREGTPLPPIGSLAYFRRVLEQLAPDELDPDYAAYVISSYQQLLDGSHPHARLDRQKTALPDRQKTALSGRR